MGVKFPALRESYNYVKLSRRCRGILDRTLLAHDIHQVPMYQPGINISSKLESLRQVNLIRVAATVPQQITWDKSSNIFCRGQRVKGHSPKKHKNVTSRNINVPFREL